MPQKKSREKSPSTTPVPSTEPAAQTDGSQLPDAEWDAMRQVLDAIYDYRTEGDLDPSKLFHKKVNKRFVPDYYETIKEPMAMSTIKQKIHKRTYQNFAEFVRDFALIPYNAQVFNRPESGAFQDALIFKEQVEKQLQVLVKDGVISAETAALPDLGDIPTYEDPPLAEGEGDGEDHEESDEDEDEEDEQDLDEDGKPKRKRGRPRGGAAAKGDDADAKKSRGRPPKLLTPTEARVLAVLRGIRKPKNNNGQLMIGHFERLPDKAAMPEYFAEIKNPMAYDQLKRKVKRKKYATLESFMADVNLIFDNAKQYNEDNSQIFKDAAALQIEAGKLYDAEKAKPDDTFVDEDGKVPMPDGILHNGELYKVGHWVHIQNPNDLTKPIPAQIYRTFKNPGGQAMVNVCWYYRPEQTVHRYDKHFYTNEVVKTGRYRDHRIDEIEGKCYIMFHTRFFKGRPRNVSAGDEVYVCRDRYNETQHQFNTIKTWASCLPDEVRDADYAMDLFDRPRRMKKNPSPLEYLLKPEQKETDELPQVQWGADGAPPKIGAVHRRPRTEKDSPPPEPTPPPPPPKDENSTPRPSQAAAAASTYQQTPTMNSQQPAPPRAPSTGVRQPSQSVSQPQAYAPQSVPSPAPPRPTPSQQSSYNPATPQTQAHARPAPSAQPNWPHAQYQQPQPPQQTPQPQHVQPQPQPSILPPNPAAYAPRPATASSYRDPPPIEVYTLPDQANLSIPSEIRAQYQRDEFGRVLFFTAPPVASQPRPAMPSGHSVRYQAAKSRRKEELALKRKQRDERVEVDERARKVARAQHAAELGREVVALKQKALRALEGQLADSVRDELVESELANLNAAQREAAELRQAVEANERKRRKVRSVKFGSAGLGEG